MLRKRFQLDGEFSPLRFELLEDRNLLAVSPIGYWSFDDDGEDAISENQTFEFAGLTRLGYSVPTAIASDMSLRLVNFEVDNGGMEADQVAVVELDDDARPSAVSLWFRTGRLPTGFGNPSGMLTTYGKLGIEGESDYDIWFDYTFGERDYALLCTEIEGNAPLCTGERITVSDGNWHHVLHSFHEAVGQRLFIDGRLVATATAFESPDHKTSSVHIGSARTETEDGREVDAFFDGNIDDVSIWDSPLSDQHAKALASGVSPLEFGGFGLDGPVVVNSDEYVVLYRSAKSAGGCSFWGGHYLERRMM